MPKDPKSAQKQQARDAVKAMFPDTVVVDSAAARKAARPIAAFAADAAASDTSPGPSLAALRRKYLGAAAADGESAVEQPGDADDVEVVQIQGQVAAARAGGDHADAADSAADPGPRAVIVSKKKGIIGAQG